MVNLRVYFEYELVKEAEYDDNNERINEINDNLKLIEKKNGLTYCLMQATIRTANAKTMRRFSFRE